LSPDDDDPHFKVSQYRIDWKTQFSLARSLRIL
jgi:hypothetical protein